MNGLEGEVMAIIPYITVAPFILTSRVDFLLIVEKLK